MEMMLLFGFIVIALVIAAFFFVRARRSRAVPEVKWSLGEALSNLQTSVARIEKDVESAKKFSEQAANLENLFSNKQHRGKFGEQRLENLVSDILPDSAYKFQYPLSEGEGKRPDCVIFIPDSEKLMVIVDAKFPFEAWKKFCEAEDNHTRNEAEKEFKTSLITHINDIADKYIISGVTVDTAMLFLPSEAVYAKIHVDWYESVILYGIKKRVVIVSPTTLIAALNTVETIKKTSNIKKNVVKIQQEVDLLLKDIKFLNDRVGDLNTHFGKAQNAIVQISNYSGRITKKRERIMAIQAGDETEDNEDSLPD